MASNPGEWYEERQHEAEAFSLVLAKARAHVPSTMKVHEWTRVISWLEKCLEQARYVGD
jgi:hypothetical protein